MLAGGTCEVSLTLLGPSLWKAAALRGYVGVFKWVRTTGMGRKYSDGACSVFAFQIGDV